MARRFGWTARCECRRGSARASRTKRQRQLTLSSFRSEQREPYCHPDDPSIARGGRTSDSSAPAKPVPVSEIAQRFFSDVEGAGIANDAGDLTPSPFPYGKG